MPDPEDRPIRLPEDTALVLEILKAGAMREAHGMLRWSSNSTFLVAIEATSDQKILAVYKPQRGERPLWDFPDGTLCHREMAAYLVSQALGWHVVPPTVLRQGLRGYGSVQFYVEHDPEINYFNLDESFLDPLMQMCAFDYVINNADRKGGHCLVSADGRLWGIDHGIGFHTAPKLRTVIWDFAGQPIPAALLADLERFYCELEDRDHPLRQQLGDLLAEAEVQACLARTRKLLQRREYPRPGPGPNYPWPPV